MIQNVSLSRVTFSDPIKETILLREMEIVRDYAKFSEKLIFLISWYSHMRELTNTINWLPSSDFFFETFDRT